MAQRNGRSGVAAQRARLLAVVEPVVVAAGYDLEDLSVSRAGARSLVRLIVDADGGVSLDAVADLSHAVSAALDEAESADGQFGLVSYNLEVSSPGVDRPLTEPRHWRRNVGRLVKTRVGDQSITGRLLAADDDGVTLAVDATERQLRYAELGPGRVQVEFARQGASNDEHDENDDEAMNGEAEV